MGDSSRSGSNRAAAFVISVLYLGLGYAEAAPAIDTSAYREIVELDLGACVAAIDRLTGRLEAGDIVGAKQAWLDARRGWTRSESVTGVFLSYQDEVLDGWPDPPFGLHRLEALDEARHVKATTAPLAWLLKSVSFDPQGLLEGAIDLLGQIGAGNDGGKESRISGNAIYDLRHNVDGIRSLYTAALARPLAVADPALAQAIWDQTATLGRELRHDNFAAVDRAVLKSESERLAALFAEAAGPLGLTAPKQAP